jgi:hypothetical protein
VRKGYGVNGFHPKIENQPSALRHMTMSEVLMIIKVQLKC